MNTRFPSFYLTTLVIAPLLLTAIISWINLSLPGERPLHDSWPAATPARCSGGSNGENASGGDLTFREPFTSTQFEETAPDMDWDTVNGRITLARRHTQYQKEVVIVSDGGAHHYAIWQDTRHDDGDIFAQRLDDDGHHFWSEDRQVNRNTADVIQSAPAAVIDSVGNLLVVWVDRRNGQGEIYGQKLSPKGDLLWIDDLRINQVSGEQGAPALAVTPDGRFVVAWHGETNGDYDIYAQQIDRDGIRQWEADVRVNGDNSTQAQVEPSVWVDVDQSSPVDLARSAHRQPRCIRSTAYPRRQALVE